MNAEDLLQLKAFGPKGTQRARQFLSWTFRIGRWFILPSLGFWGVRIRQLEPHQCQVDIPFSFFTKNPFQSTYFAALAGAGELSTGALLQCHLADLTPYSMLVIKTEMTFYKKAKSRVTFICTDGARIKNAIQDCLQSGDPQQFTLTAKGMALDEMVCEIHIQWSIKLRR